MKTFERHAKIGEDSENILLVCSGMSLAEIGEMTYKTLYEKADAILELHSKTKGLM